jgi:hypothetical protein
MSTLLSPLFIILLFVLVRSGDVAISSAIARDWARFTFYVIVAILALIAVVISLGFH